MDFRYNCNNRERQRQRQLPRRRQILWWTTGTKTTNDKHKDRNSDPHKQQLLFRFSLFILLIFLSLFYSPKMPQVVFGTMLVWSELITSHAIRWSVVICVFVFCILCFAFCRVFCTSWCKVFLSLHYIAGCKHLRGTFQGWSRSPWVTSPRCSARVPRADMSMFVSIIQHQHEKLI